MMNRHWRALFVASLILLSAGCTRKPGPASALKPTGFGAAAGRSRVEASKSAQRAWSSLSLWSFRSMTIKGRPSPERWSNSVDLRASALILRAA